MSVRKITKALFTLLSANMIGRVLSAVTILLVARELGPTVYGIFSGSLAVAQLFSAFFSLGLDGWLLRAGGQESEKISHLLGSALAIKSGLGLVWLAIFVPVASIVEQANLPFFAVLLAALCVWLDELNYVVRAGFKAKLDNQINVWLIMLDSGIFLIWSLAVMMLPGMTPQLFLLGRLVSSIISFVAGLVVFHRRYSLVIGLESIPVVVQQALPFALSIGLSAVYGKADVAIVTHALSGAYTGIYSSAVSLVSALFLIPASVYGVLLPTFSRLHKHEPHLMQRWIGRSMLGVMVLGVALGLGVFLVATPLSLGILGDAYVEVGPVLRILAWVLTFRCINFGLGAIIVAVGKQSQRVVAQLISAIFNIVVDLAIINRANLSMVAGVYVCTEFVLALGYGYIVWRWLRQNRHLVASSINRVDTRV